jgi:hypothetical protein
MKYEINLNLFSHISFYLTVNTLHHHYKDQPVTKIMVVYFEILTEHTSTLCAQIADIQDLKIGVTH